MVLRYYTCVNIHRGWDAAAIKYNELGKGVMKFGSHIKGNSYIWITTFTSTDVD